MGVQTSKTKIKLSAKSVPSKRLFAPETSAQKSNARPISKPKAAEKKPEANSEVAALKSTAPIKLLYSWTSPERIWKPKTQVWYLVSALVIMLLILLAVKLGYYIFVIALLAFLLLWFVQGTMAPWEVKHQITNEGIFTYDTFHRWSDFAYFWFAEKDGWKLLQLDLQKELNHPRITLLVNVGEDDEIFNMLVPKVKYGEMHEVGYNIFAHLVYGEYIPLTAYVPDLDQPRAKPKSTSTK
jgi:hypothetical protein